MSLWRSVKSMKLMHQRAQLLRQVCCTFSTTMPLGKEKDADVDFSPSPKCSNVQNKCSTGGRAKRKRKDSEFQFHHLIKYPPECCEDPCPDNLQRFDDCYYKTSDKAKRKYQQTWVECPQLKIKPKKICCFEKGIKPKIPRRKPKKHIQCEEESKCDTTAATACPKIVMPHCRPVAKKTNCARTRLKTICKKVNAPYPSYSECKKPEVRPRRKSECGCISVPAMCDVWALLRKRETNKPKYEQCKPLK